MQLPDALAPEPTVRLRLDKQALAHNWRALDQLSGNASAGAAVKANCYGLGVGACVPVLRDAGCDAFFVAHWTEVEALLPHVDAAQIAVLHGPVRDDDVAFAKATGVVPVLNSLSQVRRWNAARGGRCHLMVDTGINRLGIAPSELGDPEIAELDVDVLMSHLASADEDSATNERQLKAFRECLPAVEHNRASLANSAGIALGTEFGFDLTRPGLALYGGIARPELANSIRQVAFVDAVIMQIRTICEGDAVGYNGEFIAPSPMRVATVSLGYADGFLRSRGPGAALQHGEALLPILGKVSMDMIVVDMANAPELGEGDWLHVPMHLPDAAEHSGLSQYELLTVIGSRLR